MPRTIDKAQSLQKLLNSIGLTAVSYTHLDVYKRQHWRSSKFDKVVNWKLTINYYIHKMPICQDI